MVERDLGTPNTSAAIKAAAHATTRPNKPPGSLWHYTDSEGFEGIVLSGCLRFGDIRFMNDQTEFSYGWDLINDVLDEEIAKNDNLREYFFMVKSVGNEVVPRNYLFACSFSESKESISQWQRYGADGYGYCIAIDTAHVTQHMNASELMLVKMVYREADQRDAVREHIQAARDAFAEKIAERPSRREKEGFLHLRGAVLAYQLNELVLSLKNPRFEDECEWRLIRVIREDDEDYDPCRIRFSSRSRYLKPFLDIQVTPGLGSDKPVLPIERVVCGPKLNPAFAVMSAGHFLKLSGYCALVEASDLRDTWR